jgi:biopolymer transport protein ExbB
MIFILAGTARANSWWDEKWQFRKKVAFDTSATAADVKENLNEVPVLLRLHTGNFNFANAKEDGSDIRFLSSDDKMPLKFHKEFYDPASEIALFWVRVPRILAGSKGDFIWMYYGNKSAAAVPDQAGTYDVNQVLVYHLDESDGKPKDETAYGNHPSESSAETGLPAVIGNGLSFNGSGDKIVIPRSPALNFSTGFTFSTWIRIGQPQNDAPVFSWQDSKQALVIGIDQTKAYCKVVDGGQALVTEKSADLPVQSWHLLTVTAEPSKRVTVYLDGQEMTGVNLPGPVPEPAADMIVGGSAKGDRFLAGDLDEIQISKIARPAGWIRASFKGQGPDNSLAALMEEEGNAGREESLTLHLMKVVAKTITLDGWLVIGVLGALGALSWIVFITKALTLRAISRENLSFSRSFRETASTVSVFEQEDEYAASSMYKVYCAGCEELKKNITSQDGPKTIPARIMNSVKASLDKATMTESRRLGTGLMVLTLGISGGPFLGLLGTVWGVMNTFAGMAEAGEANLTAIAPGVASALACTLAGLVVAIPALFTYTYLTSRIKDLNADVYQFVDEFLLRLELEGDSK